MPFSTGFASRIFESFHFRNEAAAIENRTEENLTVGRSRAEAAVWITWLQGSNRNRDMEKAFRTWLAESASHAAAFEEVTDAYECLNSISDSQVRRGRRRLDHIFERILGAC